MTASRTSVMLPAVQSTAPSACCVRTLHRVHHLLYAQSLGEIRRRAPAAAIARQQVAHLDHLEIVDAQAVPGRGTEGRVVGVLGSGQDRAEAAPAGGIVAL